MLLVFLLTLSAYVTITLLGGPRSKLLVSMIYDSVVSFQWPRAAALAFILLAIALALTGVIMARAATGPRPGNRTMKLTLSPGRVAPRRRDRRRVCADPRADTGGRRRRRFRRRTISSFRRPGLSLALVRRILPPRQHAQRLYAELELALLVGHARDRCSARWAHYFWRVAAA